MAKLGTLAVYLGLNSTNFEKGLTQAQKGVARFKSTALSMLGAVGIGFSFSAAISGLQRFYDKMDQVGKRSTALGVTAEYYQQMAYAAERTGVEIDQVYESMNRMVKFVGEAATGKAEQLNIIKALGLDIDTLSKTSPDKMLSQIMEALNRLPEASERVAHGSRIMGETFARMTNYLRDFDGLAEEAKNKGFLISEEQIKSVEALKDAWTDIGKGIDVAIAKLLEFTGGTKALREAAEGLVAISGGAERVEQASGALRGNQLASAARRRIDASPRLRAQYIAAGGDFSERSLERFAKEHLYSMTQVPGVRPRTRVDKIHEWNEQQRARARVTGGRPPQAFVSHLSEWIDSAYKSLYEYFTRGPEIYYARNTAAELADRTAETQAAAAARLAKMRRRRAVSVVEDAPLGAPGLTDRLRRLGALGAGYAARNAAAAQSEAIIASLLAPQRSGTVLAGSMEAYKARFNNENNLFKSMEQTARRQLDAQRQIAANTKPLADSQPVVTSMRLSGE